jgi:hypothetical protein
MLVYVTDVTPIRTTWGPRASVSHGFRRAIRLTASCSGTGFSFDGDQRFRSFGMMAKVYSQENIEFGRRVAESNRYPWQDNSVYKTDLSTGLSPSKQNELIRTAGLEPAGLHAWEATASANSATPGQCKARGAQLRRERVPCPSLLDTTLPLVLLD